MRYDKLKYQRIRDLRTDMDISQSDLSKLLNIKQNTYSRYETNERNIPLDGMSFLADFFSTSVDYLMGRTDEKKPYPKANKKK